MHPLAVVLISIASCACGRIGFDSQSAGPPDVLLGHDEDEDGVADAADVCPHLAGTQDDGDGDRVGDDCDPEPNNPRQSVLAFVAVEGGQHPFAIEDGTWTPQPDAIRYDGAGLGYLSITQVVGDYRMVIGVDILAVNDAPSQHQLAIGALATTPEYYFAELNELPGFSQAAITEADGAGSYINLAQQSIPSRIRTGRVVLEVTQHASTRTIAMDGGWDGERYPLTAASPLYQGGTTLQIIVNKLTLDLRFVWIVGW